jgi:23S rRNA pseudouridine1911/1915/1917 synthase
LLGDDVYGERANARFLQEHHWKAPRQMLHAARLAFLHPRSGQKMGFEAPLPADMASCLDRLRIASIPEATPPAKNRRAPR